jgi:hypothetical protein
MSTKNIDVRRFTPSQICDHCGNEVPMVIVASHSPNGITDDLSRYRNQDKQRVVYELLSCPICEAVTLRRYCVQKSTPQSELEFQTLYTEKDAAPIRLSKDVRQKRSLERAKERSIMIRRLAVIHECNVARSF